MASISPRFGNQIEDGRGIFLPYEENSTPSIVPKKYLNYDGTAGSFSKSVEELFQASNVRPQSLIEDVQKEIEAHCEMKIQLFYQQLLLCYNSHMILKGQNAEAQAGMKKGKSDGQLAEAHCATLPSLRCWTEEEDRASFAENKPIEALSLAKDSYFFRSWNTTVKLPAEVNRTDSLIEFQTTYEYWGNETFRARCLTILNRASQGELKPKEGLLIFLKNFLYATNFHLKTNDCSILTQYKKTAQMYLLAIDDSNEPFSESSPTPLEMLTFEKNPEEHFDVIQKRMWAQMVKEVSLNRSVRRLEEKTTEILGKSVHGKHDLSRKILTKFAEEKGDGVRSESLLDIAKGKSKGQTPPYKLISQLRADKKIKSVVTRYFNELNSNSKEMIQQDLSKSNGIWKKHYPIFKTYARQILPQKTKNLDSIFRALVSHSDSSNRSETDQTNIRSFFNSTKKTPARIEEYAQLCAADPEIGKLSQKLIESLRTTD